MTMCEFHESTCNGFGAIWWTDNPIYFSSIDRDSYKNKQLSVISLEKCYWIQSEYKVHFTGIVVLTFPIPITALLKPYTKRKTWCVVLLVVGSLSLKNENSGNKYISLDGTVRNISSLVESIFQK